VKLNLRMTIFNAAMIFQHDESNGAFE